MNTIDRVMLHGASLEEQDVFMPKPFSFERNPVERAKAATAASWAAADAAHEDAREQMRTQMNVPKTVAGEAVEMGKIKSVAEKEEAEARRFDRNRTVNAASDRNRYEDNQRNQNNIIEQRKADHIARMEAYHSRGNEKEAPSTLSRFKGMLGLGGRTRKRKHRSRSKKTKTIQRRRKSYARKSTNKRRRPHKRFTRRY